MVDLSSVVSPPEWTGQALCAQTDPELWFPPKGGSTRAAKRVCGRCPVRQPCLAHALANDERFGVWGGLSEPQRRRLQSTPGPEGPAGPDRRAMLAELVELGYARPAGAS